MVTNFKKITVIKVYGVPVTVQVNKNDAICNVTPRIGRVMETYQGRPYALAIDGIIEEYKEFYKVLNNVNR